MKRTIKTSRGVKVLTIVTLSLLSTLTPSQAQNKISGGAGYFIGGYTLHNLNDINSLLADNGQPKLSDATMSLGGGGHFIIKNFVIGGEGHGLIGSNDKNANFKTTYGGGYGFFNIGYIPFHTRSAIFYPMLGIGGGGLTVSITDKTKDPSNFNDVIKDPAKESYICTQNFLINFSIGADFFTFSDKEAGSWAGGLLGGLKLGYIWNFESNNWYYNDIKLSGSPSSGISGPYIRITIGGGGVAFK